MKKISSILTIICLLWCCNFLVKIKVSASNTIYYHADYVEDQENIDLLDRYSYAFRGKVVSYISTSLYNGNGTDIPYSYFEVEPYEVIKGDISDNVIIKFYGGYDGNGDLVLLEGMEYPEIDKNYKFYCDMTSLDYEDDGRTIDHSLVIFNPHNMVEYDHLDNFINRISSRASGPIISDPIDKGEGNITNISFETAYEISLNTQRSVYMPVNTARYYKYTTNSLDYLSIYSIGSLDCIVSVYDSNYNLITSNDDVNNRGLSYTSNTNFFANFYGDIYTTYYIKVELFSQNNFGTFYMYLIKDNWTSSSINNLVSGYDSVNFNNEINYLSTSQFTSEINYGVSEWNKLESVIIQPITSAPTDNSYVYVSDCHDIDAEYSAMYSYYFTSYSQIKFNTYYLLYYTESEVIKTVIHEFGHALGLNEFTNLEGTNNAMHQGRISYTHLGNADIAVYRYLWG